MTDSIPPTVERFETANPGSEPLSDTPRHVGRPSNPVYERVGETVLRAARAGVRDGMRPDDIIREIVTEHHIRLNLSEFRLLLASRRIPEHDDHGRSHDDAAASAQPAEAVS